MLRASSRDVCVTYCGKVIPLSAFVTFSADGGTSLLVCMSSSTVTALLLLSHTGLLTLSVIRTWAFRLLIEQLQVEVFVTCVLFTHG